MPRADLLRKLYALVCSLQLHLPEAPADDDFDEPEPPGRDAQRRRATAERDEHNRAADTAVAAGVAEQRPRRAAAAAANAAMDVLAKRGELA